MVLVFVIVAVVVVFAVAAVAVGHGGGLGPAESDLVRPSLPDSPLTPDDVETVRFAIAFRGYRMDQVHEVLHRLGQELTTRDNRIAELDRQLAVVDPEGGPAA